MGVRGKKEGGFTVGRMPTFGEIGERIRAAREAEGYSQDDVAKHLGISRPVVTKIETGKKAVNGIELRKIAEFLEVTIDFLTEPLEEDNGLVALFREGENDEEFVIAVEKIEQVFLQMLGQIKLRSRKDV